MHHVTQHQVGAGGGIGDYAARTTAMKNWDWSLAGDKTDQGIQTRFSSGYKLWVTEVEIRHRGGISSIWGEQEVWQVEGVRSFGPKVVSFTVTSGQKHWYVVGAYVLFSVVKDHL